MRTLKMLGLAVLVLFACSGVQTAGVMQFETRRELDA